MNTVCWCPVPATSAPPMQGSLSPNGASCSSVTVRVTFGLVPRVGSSGRRAQHADRTHDREDDPRLLP